MHREIPSPADRRRSTGAFTRWLSLQAYGLVTRTLFRPTTPPLSMRRRFERFSARSREAIRARHPAVVFGDTRSGALEIETVRATPHPPLAESRRAWREIAEFVNRSDNPPHRRTRAALAWSST